MNQEWDALDLEKPAGALLNLPELEVISARYHWVFSTRGFT